MSCAARGARVESSFRRVGDADGADPLARSSRGDASRGPSRVASFRGRHRRRFPNVPSRRRLARHRDARRGAASRAPRGARARRVRPLLRRRIVLARRPSPPPRGRRVVGRRRVRLGVSPTQELPERRRLRQKGCQARRRASQMARPRLFTGEGGARGVYGRVGRPTTRLPRPPGEARGGRRANPTRARGNRRLARGN